MRTGLSSLPGLLFLAIALPASSIEIVDLHRELAASVDVSDRVEGQWCTMSESSVEQGPYDLLRTCSVDTGYGFGEMHVDLASHVDVATVASSGTVTSSSQCDDIWPAWVTMDFDWSVVDEFHTPLHQLVNIDAAFDVGYSFATDAVHVAILEGPAFTQPVWGLSLPPSSNVTVGEAFALAPGDYRFVMSVTAVGGSTCDAPQMDWGFLMTLIPTVSTEPESWASLKELYR